MAATQLLAATLRTGALRVAAAPDTQAGTFQRTIRYAYDNLNRLTGAQESGSTTNTLTYADDRTGNRTDGGNTSDAANQVNGWTYDTAGNLTNDGVTTDDRRTTNDERRTKVELSVTPQRSRWRQHHHALRPGSGVPAQPGAADRHDQLPVRHGTPSGTHGQRPDVVRRRRARQRAPDAGCGGGAAGNDQRRPVGLQQGSGIRDQGPGTLWQHNAAPDPATSATVLSTAIGADRQCPDIWLHG
jgi:hypothetical protein